MIIYLDTSAIVKRYIAENGSDIVNSMYEDALNGKVSLSFSLWNICESLCVFDKYYRRGWISRKDYEYIQLWFKLETKRLIKLKVLRIVPLRSRIVVKTWNLISKYHIYVAEHYRLFQLKL